MLVPSVGFLRANAYVNNGLMALHSTCSWRYSLNTGCVGGTQQMWPKQFLRRSRKKPEMYEEDDDDSERPRTLRLHV